MTRCGPTLCGYVWGGVDPNYLHRCVLPAAERHHEHVCDEGVTFAPAPFLPPLVLADDRLGVLMADAVTELLTGRGER
jgi:hypothetical protein